MTEEEEEETVAQQTPLLRAKKLEEYFGFSEIYLKYEGNNQTGTHKDRIARLHVIRAVSLGHNTITTSTCGNYGVALAYYSRLYGLKPVIFLPESYKHQRLSEMFRLGADVVMVKGKYEDATERSRLASTDKGWYDANPGPKNREINYSAYGQISAEIVDQLGESPLAITVPMGNGTTLAGLYRGFRELEKGDGLNGVPKIVGASTVNGNPILRSFLEGRNCVTRITPSSIRETTVNEPLVAYESYDGDDALRAIRETQGYAFPVTDQKMLDFRRLLKAREGIDALPASTSALEALRLLVRMEGPHSKYVAILTGGRPYWIKR